MTIDVNLRNSDPQFIICGAGKSGTSWLHVCLDEHPQVFVPAIKELHYFSYYFDRGASWYADHFTPSKPDQISGECSPSYLWHPDAPARLHDALPDAKLLFILRNPIDRAYSHYCMHLAVDTVSDDVVQELQPGSEYADIGLYYQHIQRFLSLFPEEQIRVWLHDDMKSDPRKLLAEVFEYIGVDSGFEPSRAEKTFFQRKPRKRFVGLHRWMVRGVSSAMRQGPKSARFLNRLRSSQIVKAYHTLNAGKAYPPVPVSLRQQLSDYYRNDVKHLSAWLDRDLNHWLNGHDMPPS